MEEFLKQIPNFRLRRIIKEVIEGKINIVDVESFSDREDEDGSILVDYTAYFQELPARLRPD